MKVSRETGPPRWLTDRALCIPAGSDTLALYRRLAKAHLPGVAELVPADGTLLVVLEPGKLAPEALADMIKDLPRAGALAPARQHRITVRFDGEDLLEVAAQAGRDAEGLIRILCGLTLRVKFLGFQPGFAYLDGLPPALCLPRRANPRKQVPAGSVALGGGYCGIYPSAGPGGWHLIGMANERLFDPNENPPARLQAGDEVRLVAA